MKKSASSIRVLLMASFLLISGYSNVQAWTDPCGAMDQKSVEYSMVKKLLWDPCGYPKGKYKAERNAGKKLYDWLVNHVTYDVDMKYLEANPRPAAAPEVYYLLLTNDTDEQDIISPSRTEKVTTSNSLTQSASFSIMAKFNAKIKTPITENSAEFDIGLNLGTSFTKKDDKEIDVAWDGSFPAAPHTETTLKMEVFKKIIDAPYTMTLVARPQPGSVLIKMNYRTWYVTPSTDPKLRPQDKTFVIHGKFNGVYVSNTHITHTAKPVQQSLTPATNTRNTLYLGKVSEILGDKKHASREHVFIHKP
jgi:hypothetical protein